MSLSSQTAQVTTDDKYIQTTSNLTNILQPFINQPPFIQQHNFDFISTMATSPIAIDNQSLRPKILKMIDSIQTYLDLNNEKLIEQISKQREHELIDLAKKSSDLSHRQKLQTLLIESIGSNDFRKASHIYSYLGENNTTNKPQENELTPVLPTNISHQYENTYTNGTSSTMLDEANNNYDGDDGEENEFHMTDFETSPVKNEPYFEQNKNTFTSNSLVEYDEEDPTNNSIPMNGNRPTNSTTITNTSEFINLNDSIRDAFTKAKKSNPLSPIRHLICSPGLEAKAQNCKIIILYRGRCNGICYQNKPWSKELHIHYIINTVNCNDHVSRLVKKQGIQFYNSFVLQNQERIKQLIQMYKMEKV